MTTYRSRPQTVEARQWIGGASSDAPGGYSPCIANRPDEIVAWVNANGGEAKYVVEVDVIRVARCVGSRHAQDAHPSHYVVNEGGGIWSVADSYVFEQRWECVS